MQNENMATYVKLFKLHYEVHNNIRAGFEEIKARSRASETHPTQSNLHIPAKVLLRLVTVTFLQR